MAALSISDAAKAIGHSSRSQLYRLINDGRLDDFVCWRGGKRLIEVNGLAAAVKEATQQRSNSATVVKADGAVDWDKIAETCNGWLAGDGWSQSDRGRELNGQHCFYVLWMRSMNRNLTPECWQWLLPSSSSALPAVTSRHPSPDVEPLACHRRRELCQP
jgi:hypothetical protein